MSTDGAILYGMETGRLGDRNLEILNGIAYNLIKEFAGKEKCNLKFTFDRDVRNKQKE